MYIVISHTLGFHMDVMFRNKVIELKHRFIAQLAVIAKISANLTRIVSVNKIPTMCTLMRIV